MEHRPKLIVMLTYDDKTAPDAEELFDKCRNCSAEYFGFKELGLPPERMKKLFADMKRCGKKTVLEVVAYTEPECTEGARLAADCGVDMLMGTMYSDAVLEICRANGIKYLPFVGDVTGRPSVLGGTIDGMINEAKALEGKGVDGFDLLGYRFTGDAAELNRRFAAETGLPVVIAGSIDSYDRIDEVISTGAWGFTIGSAFFDRRFGDSFDRQIENVCGYLSSKEAVSC